MKNRILKIALALCVILLALFAVACGEEKTPDMTGAEFSLDLKEEYVRNETIDLSGLAVTVSYDDGTTRVLGTGSSEVKVSGGDTATAGSDFTLTVSVGAFSQTFHYAVRDTEMTLVFGSGTLSGERSLHMVTPDNYTDVADYTPVPDKEGMAFAGWFYDEACTDRAPLHFTTKVSTAADTTLYAGYDVDYTEKFTWEIKDGAATLTSYLPTALEEQVLCIPATVERYPVIAIGEDFCALSGEWLLRFDTLTFAPDSRVEEIGVNAFSGASLSTAEFPQSLKRIGAAAFMGCDLQTLLIPANVERIDTEAFEGCTYMRDVVFADDSRLQYIGESAFAMCHGIATFDCPGELTVIADYVFNNCEGLIRVRIGRAVTSIGLHSFRGCSSLREIEVDPQNTTYSTIRSDLYTKNGKGLVRYCFGKQEATFTLPDGVTDILEGAFDAFNINSALKTIVLPSGLTSVWDYAFRSCDASFVLPATVRNLSVNAFGESLLSTFAIDADNPYFIVKAGVLYSHDGKTLIAVPSYYEEETFILDTAVETIRTGALTYNKTIKYIIIPENSALTYMESKSFILGACANLSGVYIEKAEPFHMASDAMQSDRSMSYDNFAIYIGEGSVEQYRRLWDGLYLSGQDTITEAQINDYVVSAETLPLWLLTRIARMFNQDTLESIEEMEAYLDEYFDPRFGYESFTSVFSVLDGAYRAGASLDPVMDYIAAFENKVMRFLISNYNSFSESAFGMHTSFRLAYRHYLLLPDEVRTLLSDVEEQILALVAKADTYLKIQQENFDALIALAGRLPDQFDVERARELFETYVRYGNGGLLSIKWSDTLLIFRLRCSILMSDFIETELTIENLSLLSQLLNGYADLEVAEVGINSYLEYYFTSASAREALYRYYAYADRRAEYDAFIAGINRAVTDFDFAHFDRDHAEEVLSRFDALDLSDMTMEAIENSARIRLRILLADFLAETVTEENYAKMANTFALLAVDEDLFAACGVTESEIAAYDAARQALFRIFETRQAELIRLVREMTPENFAERAETLSALYIAALESDGDILGVYPMTLTTSDGDIITNLSAVCATTIKCWLIRGIVADYTEVTEDNYEAFAARLAQPGGIIACEGHEDAAVTRYIEWSYLTDEDILPYNRLMEQYKELSGWWWW